MRYANEMGHTFFHIDSEEAAWNSGREYAGGNTGWTIVDVHDSRHFLDDPLPSLPLDPLDESALRVAVDSLLAAAGLARWTLRPVDELDAGLELGSALGDDLARRDGQRQNAEQQNEADDTPHATIAACGVIDTEMSGTAMPAYSGSALLVTCVIAS